MEQKITFIIAHGKVKIEAHGFIGPACEAATKAFEAALGGEVSDKTKKPEYHQFTSESQGESAKQGF
jgi:hypothetical protein